MKVVNSKKVKHDAIIKEVAEIIREYTKRFIGSINKDSQIMGPVEIDREKDIIKYTYYPVVPVSWIRLDLVLKEHDKD